MPFTGTGTYPRRSLEEDDEIFKYIEFNSYGISKWRYQESTGFIGLAFRRDEG